MSGVQELPQMVTELVELSKQYVRQETIEPAKRLGRAAIMGLLAALMFGIGSMLLAISATRLILRTAGAGPIASSVGYLIASVVVLAVVGIIGWRMSKYAD